MTSADGITAIITYVLFVYDDIIGWFVVWLVVPSLFALLALNIRPERDRRFPSLPPTHTQKPQKIGVATKRIRPVQLFIRNQ